MFMLQSKARCQCARAGSRVAAGRVAAAGQGAPLARLSRNIPGLPLMTHLEAQPLLARNKGCRGQVSGSSRSRPVPRVTHAPNRSQPPAHTSRRPEAARGARGRPPGRGLTPRA